MKSPIGLLGLNKFPSLNIVLIYGTVSILYIYTSDYFLEMFTSNIGVLSKLQTYKGLAFIIITAVLLYTLVKRNLDTTSAYYQQIIDVKQTAANQLKHSEEEYMLLFNHSPLPMWIFDIQTLDFILVNEAACVFYGYSFDDYKRMNLRDIRPSEDISLLENIYASAFSSDRYSIPIIVRHKKKCGEIIQVKVKITYVMFEGKQVRLASAVDVTAEMEMQNKLRVTNSKLKLASEIASLGYWTNDLLKSEIQWSSEIYKIFEVDPLTFKLSLSSIKDLFHPADQSSFDRDVFTNYEANVIQESERRIITPAGNVKWILERKYLTNDKNGNPAKIEGIVLDITKRKLAEQEIWESNERFKILANATSEAIIDWDIKNNIVLWGEGFHTMLGYDLSVCNNQLWSNNIHSEDREQVLVALNRALEDPEKQQFNAAFRFVKANGDIAHVQHKGIFIRDSEGKATRALAAMVDLTETLNRMHKIELQNETLRTIAWTQSHVVRAPLANLMGLINLLKDNTDKEVSDADLITFIGESAEKLDGIINDIVKQTNKIEDLSLG